MGLVDDDFAAAALEADAKVKEASSELDAADAFVEWMRTRAGAKFHSPLLGYDPRAGVWWVFGRKGCYPRWRKDQTGEAPCLVTDFLRIWAEGKPQRRTAKIHNALLHFLRHHPGIVLDPARWDADPDALGTPHGVVDLRTGAMRPATPSDLISKCTSIAPSPEGDLAEEWLRFLEEALGSAEAIEALQLFMGYATTAHVREHVFLAIVGAGGAGVSTFVNTIMRVLGDYATATSSETFTQTTGERHPADMAALEGVRLVVSPEVESGRRFAESRLKSFVAGDPFSARHMRGNPYQIIPVGKVVMTANGLPGLATVDRATRRRLRTVRFDNIPANPRRDLLERLVEDEGPEILRWLIDGAVYWHTSGLKFPESMHAAADDYLTVEDTPAIWLEESCIVEAQEVATVAALFASWRAFCEARNEHPGSAKSFAHLLQRRGFRPERNVVDVGTGRRVRGYRGLSLR